MALYSKVDPFEAIEFEYPPKDNSQFSPVEDKFIFCKMYELGYGQWDQLKLSIRKSLIFRFDWFIKSRSSLDLAKRCDQLIKMVETEMLKKMEDEKSAKKTSSSKPAKTSTSSSGDKKDSKSKKQPSKEKEKPKSASKQTKSGGAKRNHTSSTSSASKDDSDKRGKKKPKTASSTP
jgi:SWI/SNF-related matrix-associated actin-dependent regulator of chromatin subfamily A member 5